MAKRSEMSGSGDRSFFQDSIKTTEIDTNLEGIIIVVNEKYRGSMRRTSSLNK